MAELTLTFLGTGTSHGVPMIGCDCAVCVSDDPRDKRLRASVLVQAEEETLMPPGRRTALVVDTGPDFRFQCLRAGIRHLDAVLYTHSHTDHVMGFDDLRRFCEARGGAMPIYASAAAMTDLERIYHFAFNGQNHYPGYVRPDPHVIGGAFSVGPIDVNPVPLPHGCTTSVGYCFSRNGRRLAAYLTDCHTVPDEAVACIEGVEILVVDALREKNHPSHMTFDEALRVAARVRPRRTLFTHLGHETSHRDLENRLPETVGAAWDGLTMNAG